MYVCSVYECGIFPLIFHTLWILTSISIMLGDQYAQAASHLILTICMLDRRSLED